MAEDYLDIQPNSSSAIDTPHHFSVSLVLQPRFGSKNGAIGRDNVRFQPCRNFGMDHRALAKRFRRLCVADDAHPIY